MKVLIVGGTGFIGPFVVARLHQLGHDVTAYHRGITRASLPSGVKEVLGDRAQLCERRAELTALQSEVVVDMRPMSEDDASCVMAAFRGIAQRVVAISSQDVYLAYGRLKRTEPGPPVAVPLTEESPLREVLFPYRDEPQYARYEKVLVERVVLSDPELDGCALRLPMVYGPRDKQHRLAPYLRRMDAGRAAVVMERWLSRWRWTRGYVEDVADAIALAAVDPRSAGRIYNVGEPETVSMEEWVRQIGAAAGWRGCIELVPNERLPELLQTDFDTRQDLLVDTSRIRRELGFQERVPPGEALRRTIDWERAHRAPDCDSDREADAAEERVLADL